MVSHVNHPNCKTTTPTTVTTRKILFDGRRVGGAREDRTPDLLRAKQALSQLSYGPGSTRLVGLGGFEPPTSPLSGVRSNRLSYRPVSGRRCLSAHPASSVWFSDQSLCGRPPSCVLAL